MDLARLLPKNLAAVATNATGTNWTPLPGTKAVAVVLTNDNDTSIEFRRHAGAETNVVLPRTSREIRGICDASDISIRRRDTSNTPVTVHVEAYSVN